MDTLSELIRRAGYEDSWGIWAEAPFTPDSPARYGQRQFENGGLLDSKVFFASGTRCGDFLAEYCPRDDEGNLDYMGEGADALIEEIEQERKELIE